MTDRPCDGRANAGFSATVLPPPFIPFDMSLRAIALALLAAATPLGAQSTQPATPPQARDTASPPPSVALPPELDRVLRDYERAWRGRDSTALAALCTVDGFVLQSGRPPVRGRDAIRSLYAGQTGDPLRLRALAYATSDTVGYIIGAYGFGDDPNDTGKFTLALRRARGGAWLIASDMDNLNQRPRRP